jgi:nicotinate-nucleotide adenylyltransferase
MMDSEPSGDLTAMRLGVLGGSFNPVHLGHLHLAQHCRELFGLDQVIFVVASVPPHKPAQDLISFHHRYAMVSLATSGHPGLIPSLVELEPPASPYSIDNLGKLSRLCRTVGSNIYFIAGGDSLLEVGGWHQSRQLLMSYNFVFVMRPGVCLPNPAAALPPEAGERLVDVRGLAPALIRHTVGVNVAASNCRIFLVEAGAPDIAASQIRKLSGTGACIEHLVPAAVNEYIQKLHLYGER